MTEDQLLRHWREMNETQRQRIVVVVCATLWSQETHDYAAQKVAEIDTFYQKDIEPFLFPDRDPDPTRESRCRALVPVGP